MNKTYLKTLAELQQALKDGRKVYWSNALYEVHFIPNFDTPVQFTRTDDKLIRVSCVTNYFGSLLHESEISSCFYFEGEKH